MNRIMISQIIKYNFGLSSDQAVNGKDCLKMLKQRQFSECCSTYKIIFMDYEMPIMNGIEVLPYVIDFKGKFEDQKDEGNWENQYKSSCDCLYCLY